MSAAQQLKLSSGIRIEYAEAGAGPRAFVLVHGFTGSRDDWREHLAPLSARGRTVVLDQRGHGGSTNTGDAASYTLEQLSRDLAESLTELGIQSCDLLGHSLGGMVTLRFALAHPERVSSLVLMDTAARALDGDGKQIEIGATIARSRGMAALAQIMKAGFERGDFGVSDPERGLPNPWERIEAKLLQMDPEAFSGLGQALSQQDSLLPRLGEIRCPTTVIVGARDEPFLKPSRELVDGIPGAVLDEIPHAAHSPQIEHPAAWSRAIHAHLDRARA